MAVETRAWSAQVSWTPGYDGGYEQFFTIFYKQLDNCCESREDLLQHLDSLGVSDLADIDWKYVNATDGSQQTSLTVYNLTQDMNYAFYVRARNIIGESEVSATVVARTKQAPVGTVQASAIISQLGKF